MRAIIVEDEPLMLQKFTRLSADIPDLNVVGQFESAKTALAYAKDNDFEAAFLDVALPVMNGIELAKELRNIRHDILIIFVSAYDKYLWDFNQIGGDYYIMKPYDKETLLMAMERLRLLLQRQQKELLIRTFGRFMVLRNSTPIPLSGKAKEILALIVTKRGKEISNEEIYSTIWENRPYSNENMTVYYNALGRLKRALAKEHIEDLLISTNRGQMINTAMFDCDYYFWLDKNTDEHEKFEGEFMSEYSWGEYILADMINED
nr:response regulator [Clostridia bacterium]